MKSETEAALLERLKRDKQLEESARVGGWAMSAVVLAFLLAPFLLTCSG